MTHGNNDFDQSDWYTLILSFLPMLLGMMVNLRWTGMITRGLWKEINYSLKMGFFKFTAFWGPFMWMVAYLFYGVSVFFFFRTGVNTVSYHVFSLAMGFAIASAVLSLAWHGTFLWGPDYWIAGAGIAMTAAVTSLVSTIFMGIGAVGHGGKHPHLWVGFSFMLIYLVIMLFTAITLAIMAFYRSDRSVRGLFSGVLNILAEGRDAARQGFSQLTGGIAAGAQQGTTFASSAPGFRARHAPFNQFANNN